MITDSKCDRIDSLCYCFHWQKRFDCLSWFLCGGLLNFSLIKWNHRRVDVTGPLWWCGAELNYIPRLTHDSLEVWLASALEVPHLNVKRDQQQWSDLDLDFFWHIILWSHSASRKCTSNLPQASFRIPRRGWEVPLMWCLLYRAKASLDVHGMCDKINYPFTKLAPIMKLALAVHYRTVLILWDSAAMHASNVFFEYTSKVNSDSWIKHSSFSNRSTVFIFFFWNFSMRPVGGTRTLVPTFSHQWSRGLASACYLKPLMTTIGKSRQIRSERYISALSDRVRGMMDGLIPARVFLLYWLLLYWGL